MSTGKEFLRTEGATPLTRVETGQNKRRALVMLCLSTIAIFSNMYATQPILPVIGHDFGLLPSEAGLTISAMVLAIAASSVFYGILSDMVGRRPLIIGSTFALVIPTLLAGFAPTFSFLILCRIAQGLLIPGFVAIAITYLHEEFSEERARAVAWYTASSVLGGFTGRLQGGITTELVNWRFTFFTFALINLLSGYALWRYLPASRNFKHNSRPGGSGAKFRQRLNLQAFLACFKNRRLLGVYLLGPAIFFPFIGLFTYLPYYLTRPPFNLSTIVVSFIFVVYLIGMFAAPVSSLFIPRYGSRLILGLGVLIFASGILLTLTPWLFTVCLGLLLIVFGMFTGQSTANAYIGDSVREGQGRGSAVALYQMFFYTGGSLGGFVPGLLWQSNGWPALAIGCLISLGVGLVSVIFLCL